MNLNTKSGKSVLPVVYILRVDRMKAFGKDIFLEQTFNLRASPLNVSSKRSVILVVVNCQISGNEFCQSFNSRSRASAFSTMRSEAMALLLTVAFKLVYLDTISARSAAGWSISRIAGTFSSCSKPSEIE
jgi:hypothetical protein